MLNNCGIPRDESYLNMKSDSFNMLLVCWTFLQICLSWVCAYNLLRITLSAFSIRIMLASLRSLEVFPLQFFGIVEKNWYSLNELPQFLSEGLLCQVHSWGFLFSWVFLFFFSPALLNYILKNLFLTLVELPYICFASPLQDFVFDF